MDKNYEEDYNALDNDCFYINIFNFVFVAFICFVVYYFD